MVVGFVLFRLFDIWKPWPIRLLDQRVGGGFGIMVDDLLAGIYAAGLLQLAVYLYSL
jgi:phosphatidylglycerophosphatase A